MGKRETNQAAAARGKPARPSKASQPQPDELLNQLSATKKRTAKEMTSTPAKSKPSASKTAADSASKTQKRRKESEAKKAPAIASEKGVLSASSGLGAACKPLSDTTQKLI